MKKKIIIKIAIVAIIIALLIGQNIYIKATNLTKLERIKVKEQFNIIESSLSELSQDYKKENDQCISFAMYLLNSIKDDKDINSSKLSKTIKEYINFDMSESDIENIGITIYLSNRFIIYDNENHVYKIDSEDKTNSEIAQEEIEKYKIKKIRKIGNKYVVYYDKHVFNNPYEILNYYNDNHSETDVSKLIDYLNGKATKREIDMLLTEDVIKNVKNETKNGVLEFVVKGERLLINSIK